MTNKQTELIERYLDDELSAEELKNFEDQLKNDVDLVYELSAHRRLHKGFANYHKQRQVKSMLNDFHAEMEARGMTKPMSRTFSFRIFRQKYLPTIAIAASVALIAVFSALFTSDYIKSLEKTQQSSVVKLQREINKTQQSIHALQKELKQTPQSQRVQKSGGTCFVISAEGYLVTNYHVVEKANRNTIEVADSLAIESVTNPDYRYKVELVYGDKQKDIAILKIHDDNFIAFNKLPYTFERSVADLGEQVFTLAYPKDDIVYNEGTVSSKTGSQSDTTEYQVSIPVNRGNSGSPVFNTKGNIIGVITKKDDKAEGVAFALKTREIFKFLDEIPQDSLKSPIYLPKVNKLAGFKRPQQIKKLQDYVFQVKVY
jgi:S1-C subfamily serine protease